MNVPAVDGGLLKPDVVEGTDDEVPYFVFCNFRIGGTPCLGGRLGGYSGGSELGGGYGGFGGSGLGAYRGESSLGYSILATESLPFNNIVDDLREKMADIDNHAGEETGPKEEKQGICIYPRCYSEQARKVLLDLKDGTEVLERLKNLGVEQIEEIYLPDNPNKEGKSIGYALLEFSTHSDAMSRISQWLKQLRCSFGRDRSAKVAFSQSIHPSEEALLQGESWEEDKLKKLCEQYGEDEKVQLSRKFLSTRRKDFGFVSFVTRESAVACVEGINKAEIGEGDNKVKANLAKPQYKGRIGKKVLKVVIRFEMDGQKTRVEASKMKGNNISKRPQGKGKGVANKQNDRVIRRDERMSLGSYLHVRCILTGCCPQMENQKCFKAAF
ncbi:hypothetical protein Syun_017323 [Stephania yunnanensis]|uniref:RRM domain-containing protein n=1 Tax=Stephania yunnanensis TaxID=152371 RepID=A0AAP0J6R0_9MAGN